MTTPQYPLMLNLDETHFVAKGQRCLVYRHPEYANLLVKVLNPQFKKRNNFKTRLLRRFPGINRYRLSKCYIRELIESMRLRFSEQYSPPSCLQKVAGLVDTNLGLGLVVIAEKERNGEYAKTLKSFIQTKQFDQHIQKKLEEFYQQLAICDVVVSDCYPRNIVYAYNETEGEHFVLIDGIGEKNLIPYLRISSYLRKKYRLRQIELFKKRVEVALLKYEAQQIPQS